jgi:hypothetical protein
MSHVNGPWSGNGRLETHWCESLLMVCLHETRFWCRTTHFCRTTQNLVGQHKLKGFYLCYMYIHTKFVFRENAPLEGSLNRQPYSTVAVDGLQSTGTKSARYPASLAVTSVQRLELRLLGTSRNFLRACGYPAWRFSCHCGSFSDASQTAVARSSLFCQETVHGDCAQTTNDRFIGLDPRRSLCRLSSQLSSLKTLARQQQQKNSPVLFFLSFSSDHSMKFYESVFFEAESTKLLIGNYNCTYFLQFVIKISFLSAKLFLLKKTKPLTAVNSKSW